MLISHTGLEKLTTCICVRAGTNEADAGQVATLLVEANLQGHDSHGIGMLPMYIRNIHKGHLAPNQQVKLICESGSFLQLDGGAGFGQIVGPQAIEMGIENVKKNGLCVVALKNAHHLGRIGGMGEQVAAAGFISMHYVNVVGHAPYVAPFGGAAGRMSTNPFCCAIPVKGKPPIILDMATSTIALGKVRVAYNEGVEVPAGCLVDYQGQATRDPSVMYSKPQGAMTHFAQHKGYGMAFICELLAGALVGNWTIQPGNPRPNTIINNMLTIIIDPERIGSRDAFEHEARAMIDYLKDTPPVEGVDGVLVAGEPEIAVKNERLANGIPVDDTTWEEIINTAQKVDLAADEAHAMAGISYPR